MSKEVAEEYASSLSDLTVNSKPLINMLTILAEENIDHAGVIVETVEKHLEKVHPDIKLPVLYLVDSIIKNVGGAYTQKFSQSIVNMFTRTFKQVDEKVRSQMFKLRETWHDVFPATKLYQLDVKVNLIDPAWPIQAQPQQSNIHVNPNFLKKPAPTTSTAPVLSEEDEKMRSILAKKEQELLMLQQKKVEMELERMRRQVEMAEKSVKKSSTLVPSGAGSPSMPVALVNPVVASKPSAAPAAQEVVPMIGLSAKQRLGPVVPKTGNRIAPVSGALAAARRDPRLARRPAPGAAANPTPLTAPSPSLPGPLAAIAPNVFDIKPLERVTKRKNVITIDVQPEAETVAPRDPRRRDPRLEKRDPRRVRPREERDRRRERAIRLEPKADPQRVPAPAYDAYKPLDPKKISKLPPIPKINRDEAKRDAPAPKKRKDGKAERKKKREEAAAKDATETERPEKPAKESSDSTESSPEKKRVKELRAKRDKETREREGRRAEAEEPKANEPEVVAFKELRNFNRERYRRNRDASESPEPSRAEPDPPNVPDVIVENKDVDLRVLPVIAEAKAAPVAQKRPSTESIESKSKKNKLDKFDVLFGNEDVDLRQLPQVEEVNAPPPPAISPKSDNVDEKDVIMSSPRNSPKQKDWNEVKNKTDEVKKTPSNLDLVRAKLAEATKGKDRLGRPLLFCKSPSVERERRRTMSSDDTDLRVEAQEDFDENKKSISIIMSQAKEHLHDGQLDKNQYNTLMYQVLQLNEKLKLKEAKQRESLEISKRKLKARINDENHKVPSPKSSPNERNTFGDIDERVTPAAFIDTPPDSQGLKDSDMRVNSDALDGHKSKGLLPLPPCMPMYPYNPPMWRGSNQPRPRVEEFGPRRFRGPMPPYFRGKFDKRAMRPPFEPRMPLPMLPTPQIGMCQSESPLQPYVRSESPPPLGAPGFIIPPTDLRVIEYIDQDPFKTIQIDGIPREIRFYGDRAIIMLDWDDPREIQFLPGCRRVTFDNKDSIVLNFNEGYKQVEIDDQVFDIKFGAPTREVFINGRWFECFFGGQPYGVIIDGKPRLVQLEGPMPQVDIGKQKRLDLVAGKINLIVNATEIHPMYLDAKPQKVLLKDMGLYVTLRFVDSLRTVLINDQPFKIEYGGLPKPVVINGEKFFIRFSALPKNVKPGFIQIANMEGEGLPIVPRNMPIVDIDAKGDSPMDVVEEPIRPPKTPSPDTNHESLGLDMLASVMPASEVPASSSEYSLAEPLFKKQDRIPGLETPMDEKPANPILPILGNLNVTDLFAKLVATGIVQVPEAKVEATESKVEEVKSKTKEDRNVVHKVDMLRLETLRVKQPALVSRLYGGMQCSGCGARFPPEHTVRYSQHLDWHFRQNRRDRDSARRAHSRHWHYDLSDWLQYEEVEDLEEREKSWFETGSNAAGPEGEAEPAREDAHEVPSAAARAPADHTCALCGDLFQQFYNEDKEEWHLRNSVKHDDDYYHPQCYEDYKASLTKEEPEKEVEELPPVEKIEEPIEIKDVDDTLDQSDNESVVEVVEEKREVESVEIDEGDEDDVVFKPEPVVQVVVDDDADTDDETTATRAERDRQAEIDFSQVKVKQEPVDPDDEPIITAEVESVQTTIDSTHATVESSIDGNVRLDAPEMPPTTLPVGGIRINISKSLPTFIAPQEDKMLDDVSADDEPLPPGEELEMEYALKPSMVGREFSRQPPVMKGSEISALCSIM